LIKNISRAKRIISGEINIKSIFNVLIPVAFWFKSAVDSFFNSFIQIHPNISRYCKLHKLKWMTDGQTPERFFATRPS
jgi:hypothetical protein